MAYQSWSAHSATPEQLRLGTFNEFKIQTRFGVATVVVAAQATAEVILYEHDNFYGRAFTTER